MGILPLRRTMLPEEAPYVDTGCELHSTCLTCPLPLDQCPAEGWTMQQVRAHQTARQARRLRAAGLTIAAITEALGISRRSAFRYLQGANG